MSVTKRTARVPKATAETARDAIKEQLPRVIRALENAAQMIACSAVDRALAERQKKDEDRGEAERIGKVAANYGGLDFPSQKSAVNLGSIGQVVPTTSAPPVPELVSALERVQSQLDRALNWAVEIEAFAARLTGGAPAIDVSPNTPGSGNGSAVSVAWSAGDRVSILADRLQALAKYLNGAA